MTKRKCLHELGIICAGVCPSAGCQGSCKGQRSTLSRPLGRIEGCATDPLAPLDTRSALLGMLALSALEHDVSVGLYLLWFGGIGCAGKADLLIPYLRSWAFEPGLGCFQGGEYLNLNLWMVI